MEDETEILPHELILLINKNHKSDFIHYLNKSKEKKVEETIWGFDLYKPKEEEEEK